MHYLALVERYLLTSKKFHYMLITPAVYRLNRNNYFYVMKNFFTAFFLLICCSGFAQQKPTDLDKSPLDYSYCPQSYPILKMNGKAGQPPVARVIYSRPQKAGRQIFGNIVAYNQVWRLGANEATEVEFFRDIKINGTKISKGRYSMYAICSDTAWTL
ncbi:MAG TPA: DUF2911 domain-containing protein, partial [Chitinophagaceae bacterium]|nr:DUF2911 domain-containing protein [Chitinophagaceae bacterium]